MRILVIIALFACIATACYGQQECWAGTIEFLGLYAPLSGTPTCKYVVSNVYTDATGVDVIQLVAPTDLYSASLHVNVPAIYGFNPCDPTVEVPASYINGRMAYWRGEDILDLLHGGMLAGSSVIFLGYNASWDGGQETGEVDQDVWAVVRCPDTNGNHAVNLADINVFTSWLNNQDPKADLNYDGAWNTSDITLFSQAVGTSCP